MMNQNTVKRTQQVFNLTSEKQTVMSFSIMFMSTTIYFLDSVDQLQEKILLTLSHILFKKSQFYC